MLSITSKALPLANGLKTKVIEAVDQTKSNRPWSVFGDKPLSEPKKGFTHLSLFSGCGGFDLGFRKAGFITVWANDIDQDACETFRKNLGPINEGDIRTTSLPTLEKKPDVLTAGFPCQPFSNAGSRRGTSDARGDLYTYALGVIEKFRPKVIVFENVRGILSFKVSKDLLIQRICQSLHDLGYECQFKLIDASDYRVAQRRLRLFIIGVQRKEGLGHFHFPSSQPKTGLSIGDILSDINSEMPNQSELMRLNPQAVTIGAMVPEGGSWKDIPYENLPTRLQYIRDNMRKYRWPKFYRRFHRDDIAGTVTAAFKPENAGVWHPVHGRVFSVREIARIQSFPDWFTFEGRSVKSKYQQIGNAVAPRLAYEMAMEVANSLHNRESMTMQEFLSRGTPLRPTDKCVKYIPAE